MIKKPMKGFTLIELMITVAVIGILAGIAVPQYTDYITKSNRSDATKALGRMLDKQEQYVLRNNAASYTTDVSLIGGAETEFKFYTLSVVSADSKGFVLQAVADPDGPQANDTGCTTLTIASTGAKTPVDCWVK